jgi:hypothetical protein
MYVFYNVLNFSEAILKKHTSLKRQKIHEAMAVLDTATVVQTT